MGASKSVQVLLNGFKNSSPGSGAAARVAVSAVGWTELRNGFAKWKGPKAWTPDARISLTKAENGFHVRNLGIS